MTKHSQSSVAALSGRGPLHSGFPFSQGTRLSPSPGALIPTALGSLLHLCSTGRVPPAPRLCLALQVSGHWTSSSPDSLHPVPEGAHPLTP